MSNITDALPISKKDLLNLMNAFIPKGMIAWFALDTAPEGWEVYTPLLGKYPVGANAGIGNTVEAGLPNITGTGKGTGSAETYTGAFSSVEFTTDGDVGGYLGSHSYLFTFNASKSNSIYGKSNTVTPPSVKLLPCIKL